jgi:hypothetical protein
MAITTRDTRGRGMRKRFLTVLAIASLLALAGGVGSVARPGSATPVSAAPLTGLALSPTPTTALVGQTVSFNATATAAPTFTISSFSFNFGDGSVITVPGSGMTATATQGHAYSAANTYLASVTAMDTGGNSGTASASITVGAGQRITVSTTPNTSFAVVGQPVAFSVAVTDPNTSATITSTTINFGDGSGTATVPAGQTFVSHSFFGPGTFNVTSTATDSLGNTGTGSNSILVSGGGVLPVNGFNGYNQYPYTGAYNGTNAYGTTGYVAPTTTYNAATNSYATTSAALPSNGISVSMAQGWDIVGGPSGTVINGNVGPLYTYQAADTSYQIVPAGSTLVDGQGYWAYFAGPATDIIPLAAGQGLSVQLPASHFVMISNPGSGTATVMGADFMVVFNTATNQYQATTSLGPGQGAWVWSWNGGTARIQSS